MELLVTKLIGKHKYHFNFSGNNLHEALMESQKLSFESVDRCGLCGSDHLELTARVAQGFKYVSVKCRSCRAEVTAGRTKEDADVFFLRKKENGRPGELDWVAYTPDAQ